MQPSRFVLAVLSVIWGIGIAPVSALADEQSDAIAVVERVHQTALMIAHDRATALPAGPFQSLRHSFDGVSIARAVLADYWASARASERQEFVDALLDAIVYALVRRLGKHRSEDFSVVSTRVISNGDILVRTRLDSPVEDPITVDWRIRRCRTGLCIVDLIVGGASVSLERRDDVAARLAASGGSLGKLIADLRKDLPNASP